MEQDKYADADEPACKYCGGSVDKMVPPGKPYLCGEHGRLWVDEVLGVEPGEIRPNTH